MKTTLRTKRLGHFGRVIAAASELALVPAGIAKLQRVPGKLALGNEIPRRP